MTTREGVSTTIECVRKGIVRLSESVTRFDNLSLARGLDKRVSQSRLLRTPTVYDVFLST